MCGRNQWFSSEATKQQPVECYHISVHFHSCKSVSADTWARFVSSFPAASRERVSPCSLRPTFRWGGESFLVDEGSHFRLTLFQGRPSSLGRRATQPSGVYCGRYTGRDFRSRAPTPVRVCRVSRSIRPQSAALTALHGCPYTEFVPSQSPHHARRKSWVTAQSRWA